MADTIHSIRHLENTEDNTFTLIVGTDRVGEGILFSGQTVFVERDNGYSGNPMSLQAWHPFLDKATWIYVADSLKVRRIDVDGVVNRVGIPRPNRGGVNSEYVGVITPSITEGPENTIYNLATGDDATAQADWGSGTHFFGGLFINGQTETITLRKETRISPGGAVNVVRFDLIPDPNPPFAPPVTTAGTVLPATVDVETDFAEDAHIEAFMNLSKPEVVARIRLSLILEPRKTGMVYSDVGGRVNVFLVGHGVKRGQSVLLSGVTGAGNDQVNGRHAALVTDDDNFALFPTTFSGAPVGGAMVVDNSNFYYAEIVPSALVGAGLNFSEEALTAVEQARADLRRLRTEYAEWLEHEFAAGIRSARERAENSTFESFARSRGVDIGILEGQISGAGGGYVFSRSKESFKRVGTDPDLDWKNVTAVEITINWTDDATGGGEDVGDSFFIGELDIVNSISVLNSRIGGAPYDWRYTYYESTTGVESNPSPIMPEGIDVVFTLPTITVDGIDTSLADKIRIYRRGGFLAAWHLIDTIDNPGAGNTAQYIDYKDDLSIATQPILEQDNYLPLPLPVEVTQLLKFSERFVEDSVWVTTDASVNENVTVAPNQSETATELIVTAADGEIRQTVPATTVETFFSIFVKAKTLATAAIPHIRLFFFDGTDTNTDITLAQPNFNVKKGGLLGVWERFVITCPIGTTAVGIKVIVDGDEVYIWGAQLEQWDADEGFLEPARYIQDLKFQETERTARELVLGDEDDDTFKGTMQAVDSVPIIITEILEDGGPPEVWWGPLSGKYLFGIRGHKVKNGVANLVNAGDVYWSKAARPDLWRPQDRLAVTHAGEPLQNGFIYNTRSYAFTTEGLYIINIDPRGLNRFVSWKTPVAHGLWKRWALAIGPKIWWLGKDGIYESTGGVDRNITNPSFIRPLFTQGGDLDINGYAAIDMEADDDELRLMWRHPYLYFFYLDAAGERKTLRYEPALQRWEFHDYELNVRMGYGEDEDRRVLLGTEEGFILKLGGAITDAAVVGTVPVIGEIRTGSLDQGLPALRKLYGDIHIEAEIPLGESITVTPFLDDEINVDTPQVINSTTDDRKRYKIEIGRNTTGRSIALGIVGITGGIRLHEISFAFQEHQISELTWDSHFEDDGNLEDKWITGLYLEADTNGVDKLIRVDVDGVEIPGSPFTINTTLVKPVKISWEPVRGVTMRFTSEAVEARLWSWRWIWNQEPVELEEPFIWEWLDWPYEKFIKGFSIKADTFNEPVTLELRIDGDEGTNPLGAEEFTFTHDGPQIAQFSIDNAGECQVLVECLRLTNTSSNPLRVYNLQWIFDTEPYLSKNWITQERSFNLGSWGHIRDAYIALRSTTDVTLDVTIDGVAQTPITLTNTAGGRVKRYIQFEANKGKVFRFKLSAAEPFKVYNEDTNIQVKGWNNSVGLRKFQLPFEGGIQNP